MNGVILQMARTNDKEGAVALRPAGETILPEDVEKRILTACKTIRALPDRDRRFQVVSGCWPEVVRSVEDAYGYTDVAFPKFRPKPSDVSDMLVALSWARCLEDNEFKLVWWRSFDISFRHIGLRLHRSDETARSRYRGVVVKLWWYVNYELEAIGG